MAKDRDLRYEPTHEVPASDYIFIAGAAIHKSFFLYWSVFEGISLVILILVSIYTPFLSILAKGIWDLFIRRFWYITFPALFISAIVGHFYWERRKKRKAEQLAEENRRKKLANLLKGGDTKK